MSTDLNTPKTIQALWVAPYKAILETGLTKIDLIPGETIVEIGYGEAHESDNWQPVEPEKKTSKKKTEGDA
jgi:hypothetical protein